MKRMTLLILQGKKRVKIKQILQKVKFLNEPYTRWKWREKKVSWGPENPDKVFFVVRRATSKVGLFSYVMTNMGLVRYALEQGYIPVIDMQSNPNTYLEESQVGKENAWEFYFEQPCGYSMDSIRKSKNIILSNGMINEKSVYPRSEIAWDEQKYVEWKKFFSQYFHVHTDIMDEANRLYSELFNHKKVIGVLARGTDYVNNRPKKHPIQPDAEVVISDVEKMLEDKKGSYIYLATEDEAIYREFKKKFGDILQVSGAKRCENTGTTNINDAYDQSGQDRYMRGKEYLINILLLSKCDSLVAGNVGGTLGAILLTNGYEYQKIYNIGVYE